MLFEKAVEIRHIGCGSLGKLLGLLVVAVDGIGIYLRAVGIGLPSQRDSQRKDLQVITGDQPGVQVGGAVAGEDDVLFHNRFSLRRAFFGTVCADNSIISQVSFFVKMGIVKSHPFPFPDTPEHLRWRSAPPWSSSHRLWSSGRGGYLPRGSPCRRAHPPRRGVFRRASGRERTG